MDTKNDTTKPKRNEQLAASALSASPGSGVPKLYEITAMVSYSVVIRADSKEDALKHVETWEHAWDANADLLEAHDVDVLDVRDGTAEDAHEDISSQNNEV